MKANKLKLNPDKIEELMISGEAACEFALPREDCSSLEETSL